MWTDALCVLVMEINSQQLLSSVISSYSVTFYWYLFYFIFYTDTTDLQQLINCPILRERAQSLQPNIWFNKECWNR